MKKFLIQTLLFIWHNFYCRNQCIGKSVEQGNKPYLLLVTFYTKQSFLAIDDAWLTEINKMPYDGIAVMLTGAYNTDLITATSRIHNKIKLFQARSLENK
jgi:hypothetical protein